MIAKLQDRIRLCMRNGQGMRTESSLLHTNKPNRYYGSSTTGNILSSVDRPTQPNNTYTAISVLFPNAVNVFSRCVHVYSNRYSLGKAVFRTIKHLNILTSNYQYRHLLHCTYCKESSTFYRSFLPLFFLIHLHFSIYHFQKHRANIWAYARETVCVRLCVSILECMLIVQHSIVLHIHVHPITNNNFRVPHLFYRSKLLLWCCFRHDSRSTPRSFFIAFFVFPFYFERNSYLLWFGII